MNTRFKLLIVVFGALISMLGWAGSNLPRDSQNTAPPEHFKGRVVAVLDGDTIEVLSPEKRAIRLRLAEIDAPEIGHGRNRPGQPYGDAAKRNLSDICYGKLAAVSIQKTDKYDRSVANVSCEGVDANMQQVADGFAWVYRAYSKRIDLLDLERSARHKRIGLWHDSNATEPWAWRKQAW